LAAKSIFGCSRAIQRMKIKITIARMELEYKYELNKYKKTREVTVTSAMLKSFKFKSFCNGKFFKQLLRFMIKIYIYVKHQ